MFFAICVCKKIFHHTLQHPTRGRTKQPIFRPLWTPVELSVGRGVGNLVHTIPPSNARPASREAPPARARVGSVPARSTPASAEGARNATVAPLACTSHPDRPSDGCFLGAARRASGGQSKERKGTQHTHATARTPPRQLATEPATNQSPLFLSASNPIKLPAKVAIRDTQSTSHKQHKTQPQNKGPWCV
jgi:hypothetical protein